MKNRFLPNSILFFFVFFVFSCGQQEEPYSTEKNTQFTLLPSSVTGVNFKNVIEESLEFNFLNYLYVYNGGGVSIGDINNDGLDDIFLSSNQKQNHLYLNKGDLKFEEISASAGIQDAQGWSTGVSMVDINNDGWLDIYICKSGLIKDENQRRNKLFINNKDNTFSEKSSEYLLDISAFSMQSYFLDLDKDGDLDMYLVNHRVDFNNTTKINSKIQRDISPLTSDKIYVNNNGKFTSLYKNGINKTWGLSASIADFNNDSWPDIYVCNDFLEPDHLFINDQKGGFIDSVLHYMDHISFYSMGSDVADINNDGLLDLYVLDMASPDHVRSKVNMASMNVDNFNAMVSFGYHHQYMSNALHLNKGDAAFSEIGQFAGVSKTDWSWSALFADFDNDGYKDLHVTNGVRRDMTDNDLKGRLRKKQEEGVSMTLDEVFNSTNAEKLHNRMYRNEGNTRFADKTLDWGLDKKSFSNGAAYGDLDNDGDLDLVVNNIEDEAFIYRNNSTNNYLGVQLKGNSTNPFGIGTTVEVFTGNQQQYYQQYLNRGFVSSMSPKINIGLGQNEKIDSVRVTWYNGYQQVLKNPKVNQLLTVDFADAKEKSSKKRSQVEFITKTSNPLAFNYIQKENAFEDFEKEILLPQKMSTQGPQSVVGDVNGDGLDDMFITGAKGFSAALYVQNTDGSFQQTNDQLWKKDQAFEGTGCLLFDFDNDTDLDLYVVSGGNEYPENSPLLQDRLYINDGKGVFTKDNQRLPKMLSSGYAITSADYDNDGDLDLFIGGRVIPGKYPLAPQSFLLENKEGTFIDVTEKIATKLRNIGLVTDALFSDFDGDKDLDLIVVGEWMAPTVFVNDSNLFIAKKLSDETPEGWWYTINTSDFNQDGQPDYFIGNLGLNNKFNVNPDKYLHLFASDFDDSGNIDIVLGNEYNGTVLPLRGRECSSEQMPFVKEKFPDYKSFSEADLNSIYTPEKLDKALHHTVNNFNTTILISKGNGVFEKADLPEIVQYGPTISTIMIDINDDGYLDILGAGNIYETEPETVQYDASKGYVLLNDGKGHFVEAKNHQFLTRGNIKDIQLLEIENQPYIVALQNSGPIQFFKLK